VLRRRGGFAVGFQAANVLAWLRDAVVPLAGGVLGGAVVVGHLQFAWRTSQLVSSVEDVVARVAFPAFSRLQHDRTGLALAVAGATTASAYLIVPAQLWVAAVAPTLVPWLFGPQWDAAIVPLQLACLAAVTRFPVRMVRQGEFAGGRIRRGVQIVAIGCALTWLLVPPGLVWGGEVGAAVGLLISGALALGAMAALPTLGRVPFRDLTRIVVESALAAGAGSLVLALAPWSTTLDLAASGAATLALLAALFLLLERAPLERLRRILLSSEAPGPAVV
jgi:O-antigen/teichoic acid export membrane protein